MTTQQTSLKGPMITTGVLALLIVIIMVVLFIDPWRKPVTNFATCQAAGGTILESYPEQCLYDGKTYTNGEQQATDGEYIGLTEEEALQKAKESDTPARVVERDDESLPVTMDFVFGRQNLYVRDGRVYKVTTEGDE